MVRSLASAYTYKRICSSSGLHILHTLHTLHILHKIEELMKTAEQTRRAVAQRDANAEAKAAGKPMPFANPWDSRMHKLPEGSTHEEQMKWCADLAQRYAPHR